MKLLHDTWWGSSWLAEEARTVLGRGPTDTFEGATLDVPTARKLGAVLLLPGIGGPRIVVASYEDALPRALDVLLAPVEETNAHLIMACPPPLTDTFRSRFVVQTDRLLSVQEFYVQFGTLGKDRTLDDLLADNPEVPSQRIHSLYDSFCASMGQVASFITAVHDGSVELATKTALGFGHSELDLLHAELEAQLSGHSLVKRLLTGTSHENLLTACQYRDLSASLSPPAHAAMILHTLL